MIQADGDMEIWHCIAVRLVITSNFFDLLINKFHLTFLYYKKAYYI